MPRKWMRIAVVAAMLVATCAIAAVALGATKATNSGNAKLSVAMIGSLGAGGNDFVFAQYCGARQEAKKLGVKLTFQAPVDYSAPEQIVVLRNVIATKPKVIVIEPNDSVALQAPLDAAVKKGIKVVILDTVTKDMSKFSGAIVTSDIQGGETAAKAMINLTGGKGSVAAFGQSTGFSTTDHRLQGFALGLKGSGLTYLGPQYTQGSVTTAQTITSGLISRNPDLAGLFDTGGTAYLGIGAALQQSGKNGVIKVIAFDADRTRVSALQKGQIQGIISQKIVTEGQLGVRYAVMALKGQKPPKLTSLPTAFITAANLHSPAVAPFVYSHQCAGV
jgi:ribose transport system substrate-binding protein